MVLVTKKSGSWWSGNDKWYFATEAALNSAYPTWQNGWYATVGTTDTMWVWDWDTAAWVDSGIAPATPSLQDVTDRGANTTNAISITNTSTQLSLINNGAVKTDLFTNSSGNLEINPSGWTVSLSNGSKLNMSGTTSSDGRIEQVGRIEFVNNGFFGVAGAGYISFNTSVGTIFNQKVRFNDNLIFAYGTSRDYSIGYNSSASALQIVAGTTLGSNIKLEIDGDSVSINPTGSALGYSLEVWQKTNDRWLALRTPWDANEWFFNISADNVASNTPLWTVSTAANEYIQFSPENTPTLRMEEWFVGIGGSFKPSTQLHVIDTAEQIRAWYDASNYASFTVGSSGNLTIAPTGGQVLFPAGSASNPSVSFTGESDTGFYQVGTDQIGITTSGIARFFVNTLAFRSSGVGGISINNTASQSASNPGYSIRGDEDTGMYSNIANTLQWSTGGTERMLLNSTGLGIGTSSISARLNLGAGTTTVAPLKLTAGTNLTTPEAGALEFDWKTLFFTPTNARRSINLSADSKTTDTTVANTTTETTIYSISRPANQANVGKQVILRTMGYYSTNSASDVFTVRLKIGSTTIASFTTSGKNVANSWFDTEWVFTIRTLGASGTLIGMIKTESDTDSGISHATSTTAIDTTITNTFSITIQRWAASAWNTLTAAQGIARFLDWQ